MTNEEDEQEGKLFLWHLEVPNSSLKALVLAEDEEEALSISRRIRGAELLPWEVEAFTHVATVPFLVCLVDKAKVLVVTPNDGKPN